MKRASFDVLLKKIEALFFFIENTTKSRKVQILGSFFVLTPKIMKISEKVSNKVPSRSTTGSFDTSLKKIGGRLLPKLLISDIKKKKKKNILVKAIHSSLRSESKINFVKNTISMRFLRFLVGFGP